MHRRVRQELTPLRTLDLDLEEQLSKYDTFVAAQVLVNFLPLGEVPLLPLDNLLV